MNDGRVRFGVFEFSPRSGELFRDGRPVKLQAQPGRVLAVLVAHAGEVVPRELLQQQVWGSDTHVDFERGLNFCIAQVRSALRDSAESPRFVATIPKQGYRFIAPVEYVAPDPPADVDRLDRRADRGRHDSPAVSPVVRTPWLGVIALLVIGIGIAIAWPLWGNSSAGPPTVIVVPFYNETGRPELNVLAKDLADVTVARLAAPERLGQLSVIGNAPSLQNPFARTDVQSIARELGAQWVVIGQLKSDGDGLRLVGHLIRSADMKHVWANTLDDPSFGLAAQQRAAESIAAAVSQALASN